MLKLPHPLFADDIHLERISRRPRIVEKDPRSPNKEAHGDHERNYRPEHFQSVRAGDGPWYFVRRAAAILNDEENKGQRNQQREKNGDARKIEIESIHLTRFGGGAFRNPWYP